MTVELKPDDGHRAWTKSIADEYIWPDDETKARYKEDYNRRRLFISEGFCPECKVKMIALYVGGMPPRGHCPKCEWYWWIDGESVNCFLRGPMWPGPKRVDTANESYVLFGPAQNLPLT